MLNLGLHHTSRARANSLSSDWDKSTCSGKGMPSPSPSAPPSPSRSPSPSPAPVKKTRRAGRKTRPFDRERALPGPPEPDYITEQWSQELSNLMARTQRAYDLVVFYKDDAPTGLRWSTAAIEQIEAVGQDLRKEIDDLKYCELQLTKPSFNGKSRVEEDGVLALKVRGGVVRVKALCEEVQRKIAETEELPVWVEGELVVGEVEEDEEEDEEEDVAVASAWRLVVGEVDEEEKGIPAHMGKYRVRY